MLVGSQAQAESNGKAQFTCSQWAFYSLRSPLCGRAQARSIREQWAGVQQQSGNAKNYAALPQTTGQAKAHTSGRYEI
jgi:hypothetical protein